MKTKAILQNLSRTPRLQLHAEYDASVCGELDTLECRCAEHLHTQQGVLLWKTN